MPPTRRTQQERGEESTTRLIHAAAELIAEGSYEAATAAEIGRRAGYSRSMVRARFGSKQQLIDAVVTSAYEGPLTVTLPETTSGLERAGSFGHDCGANRRITSVDAHHLRGRVSRRRQQLHLSTRVADWVTPLRADTLAAVLAGQADGSIRTELDPEPTAHAIVAEGIGSAFLWTVDPTESFRARITQRRRRTLELLTT